MVFRFSYDQDKELLRELIRLKPFAAKRGTILQVWVEVASSVSSAIAVTLNVKQVRDRLNMLKATFNAEEAASALASGVEESLDAVNIQSHYDDRSGLVREYISLERLHKAEKQSKKDKKQQKEEDLAHCAEEVVRESIRRRAVRMGDLENEYSDESANSDAESAISSVSTSASISTGTTSTPGAAHQPSKRSNAFVREIERQEKYQKLQLDLQERELLQTQKRFEQRLDFERQ